ncbi:MAG: hypothetical protein LBE36_06520 [Flavobacteriaceae bacterium]|jgi:hypothetical protein|nr:hypothetical protein [Flavobacteriaceae bacterium]
METKKELLLDIEIKIKATNDGKNINNTEIVVDKSTKIYQIFSLLEITRMALEKKIGEVLKKIPEKMTKSEFEKWYYNATMDDLKQK